MSDFDEITKDLRKSRSGFKSRITLILNELEKESINRFIFDRSENKINQMQTEIYQINEKIDELCDEKGILEDDEKRQSDRATECSYVVKTAREISDLEEKIPKEVLHEGDQKQKGDKVVDAEALAKVLADIQKGSSAPKLQCPKFSGENIVDKFEFKNFLSQFETVCN